MPNIRSGGLEVTRLLIAVNVIAWVGEVAGHGSRNRVFGRRALNGALSSFGPGYWRLITGGFLHYPTLGLGLFRIGFNMCLLWSRCNRLERARGSGRFAASYFSSVL